MDKSKRFIARAPVSVGGRDFRPGDTVVDADAKDMKNDIEAGRIEEVDTSANDARDQQHVGAVMGVLNKVAEAIASDKLSEAREAQDKAARDRVAAERASVKTEKQSDVAANPVGGVVLDTTHGTPKFVASGKVAGKGKK